MPQKTNVCGVISLTLSIISVCFACCYGAGLLFAIPAFIFGLIGITRENMLIGTAVAGLIISVIGILLSIFTIVLWEYLTKYMSQYESQMPF